MSYLFRLFTALLLFVALVAQAAEAPVTLGVLAFRPKPETVLRWQATVDYLSERTGRKILLMPFTYQELEAAIQQGSIEFVLTNPAHYVLMTRRNGLSSPLATLIDLDSGQPLSQFGGVIIARADRRDITRLSDLAGKTVATPDIGSLGGYQMQALTLAQAGLRMPQSVTPMITGMPHDRVVYAVLEGRADAGFVRTGLLESLSRAGKLDFERLKVINPRSAPGFPYLLSTRLYPEWPLAALPGTDDRLAQEVAKALFSLRAEHPAARQGNYFGWSIPADYEPVRALLQELRLPPFDEAPEFTWSDVFAKHGLGILVVTFSIVIIVLLLILLAHRQRELRAQEHQRAEERQRLLAALGEGVYGVNAQGRCSFINPAALAMLGFQADELLGQDQHRLIHHHRPDGQVYPHCECPIHMTLEDGQTRRLEEWFLHKDGSGFPVEMTVAPMPTGDGGRGAVVVFHDIRTRLAARARDRLLVSALEAAANGVVITDREARIEWANPAFETLTGFSRAEAVGKRPAELVRSGMQDKPFYETMWQTILSGQIWRGEVVNRRRDGSLYDEELIIAPVLDDAGQIAHFVGIKQDISERKQLQAELVHLASSDPLTGLANRRHFMARLDEELARLRRFDSETASLLMLDLDHFKQINDRYGHASGDAVLRAFASLIGRLLRQTDLAGRVGGEEFAILLVGSALEGALEFAERLRRETAQLAIQSGAETISITVSIGVSTLMADDSSVDAALARADRALYQAKANGRNRVERGSSGHL
jgi:diguanylate cyclase (GGDEF)-like protein/PAS domain S-box-containing protein